MNINSISFVVPMYNEARGIEAVVKSLAQMAEQLTGDYEIIIVDDASSDDSAMIADAMAARDPRIKVERLKVNTKFGGALKKGLKRARKDIVIYTDSDLPISFQDIKGALSLLDGSDVVTAFSRVKKGETLKRVIMSKVYNFLIQFLFRANIRDINSGFKIYKKKVLLGMDLISESPFVDVEIFVRAMRKNFTIKQYPVIFKHREKGVSYISRPAVILATLRDMLKFKCQKSL